MLNNMSYSNMGEGVILAIKLIITAAVIMAAGAFALGAWLF